MKAIKFRNFQIPDILEIAIFLVFAPSNYSIFQLITVDPTLEQLGLPAYPPLPADTDSAKVEEIRRTVYVGNLPKGVDGNEVLELFNMYFGEVG